MSDKTEIQALRSANAGLLQRVADLERERDELHADSLNLKRANERLRKTLRGVLEALEGARVTNAIQRGKDLL